MKSPQWEKGKRKYNPHESKEKKKRKRKRKRSQTWRSWCSNQERLPSWHCTKYNCAPTTCIMRCSDEIIEDKDRYAIY
jgi:hypothetical protein